ncbi:hypothetical protein FB45DRAFT_1058257 [Roridomyces roridus]|uniref:Uncharacterized protein n=1 Tax=Roridomyces roridus TaxID=1738132 RepID=A0AAD7BT96_9AGAR|nr:hypothetical protein FB45DRAFT_1058257 [Roridomyces roridus]
MEVDHFNTGTPLSTSLESLTSSFLVWVVPHDADSVYAKVFPLPLPGTDRFLNAAMNASQIFPGRLDDERLIAAFRDSLTYYPHVSARLRIKGDDWWLSAGKRGIPIRFQTTEEPLNHHLTFALTPTEIIDQISLDLSGASECDWDEPMLQITVTYCPKTNESAIGWSHNHILGDGHLVWHFWGAWSQYYQGKEPLFGRPTYEKYRSPHPPGEYINNPETDAFVTRHLPHLKEIHPPQQYAEMRKAARESTTFVELFFSAHQLEQLRTVAGSWAGHSSNGDSRNRTAPQDALGAYFIATMNRCLDVPITRVIITVTSRGIKNPDYLKPGDWRAPGYFAAGNNVYQVYTPTLSIEEASSIGAVAAAIRKSVKEARQYEHAKRVFAISEPMTARLAKEKTFYKAWGDGMLMRTPSRADGSILHFGFGNVRIATYEIWPGMVRCFQAPSVRQLDGSWIQNGDGLIMWTLIPTKIHDKFLAMVATDLNSNAFPVNIATREREAQEKLGRARARL